MNDLRARHKMSHDEFARLVGDPCLVMPFVGDAVVVASGLLTRGHYWIRERATVVDLGESSIEVHFDRDDEDKTYWIHPALITDVITKGSENA